MKVDRYKAHLQILKEASAITERYFELKSKSKVAAEFGISSGGVDSALFHTGHPNNCGKSFLKRMRTKDGTSGPLSITENKVATQDEKGGLQAGAVAAELLTRVIETISKYDEVLVEARTLKLQVNDLEARLKKEREEKERILRVHNEMVKQSNNGKLPSIEEVVRVLRREHTVGKPL